jgi:hypothetical protein
MHPRPLDPVRSNRHSSFAPDISRCNADPTQTGKSFLRVLHESKASLFEFCMAVGCNPDPTRTEKVFLRIPHATEASSLNFVWGF